MDNIIHKEFQFESFDDYHPYDGPTPSFTVRKATPAENQERDEKLLELRSNYSAFIREGYKFIKFKSRFEWENYRNWLDEAFEDDDSEFVDDTNLRFEYIIDNLKLESKIRNIEIPLALVGCNLLSPNGKERLVNFRDGRFSSFNWGFYTHEEDQVHEKILELNPSWSGEFERMSNFLKVLTRPKNADLKQGNFNDLVLKTAFIKNKNYLRSLIDEIRQDVFENRGATAVGVNHLLFREKAREYKHVFKKTLPPFENIIYFPESLIVFDGKDIARAKNVHVGNYIGVIEHGNHEIRIIAQKNGFMYWDTFIDEIIPTLRTAIEWWKRKPHKYNKEKLELLNDLDADTSWMDEAQDFYSDMEDDGYSDVD
jgi:hypothetical protein